MPRNKSIKSFGLKDALKLVFGETNAVKLLLGADYKKFCALTGEIENHIDYLRSNRIAGSTAEHVLFLENRAEWLERGMPNHGASFVFPPKWKYPLERAPNADHPPPYVPALNDRFDKLRAYECELAREAAEWVDTNASPSALRYYAELIASGLDEYERRLLEHKRQAQERERLAEIHAALDLMNLPHDAASEQIKAQHHHLAKRLHPDTNANDQSANSLLRQVTEAMRVLRDTGRV